MILTGRWLALRHIGFLDSTKRAIAILRAKGIRVFIASGRQLLAINNLEDLQFDGYVTLNGGYCIVGEKVIYKHSMPSEDMVSLVRYMEEQESFPYFCA